MPRFIRRTRLFPIAFLAMVVFATFAVSANDQQTGTWKIVASDTPAPGDTAPASATPNRAHRTAANLISGGSASVALPDGGIVVAGGRRLERASTQVLRFDPGAGTSLLAPLNIGRADLTATTLDDGRVLVTGGTSDDGTALASAEILAGDVWTIIPMREARAHHTATLLKDGRVLIAGGDRASGRDGSGAPRIAVSNTLEIFDPATNQFSAAGVMSVARARHAAAELPDGSVLVAGGESRNEVTGALEVLRSTELIDLSAGTRRDGPEMDLARENFTATSLVSGDILIAGGDDGAKDTASAERFVSAEGRFAAVGWLQQIRRGHAALRLPDNNGVLIAGGTSSGEAVATAEIFLPASAMFVSTGNTMTSHANAMINRTRVAGTAVIMSGSDGTATEQFRFATVTTDKSDYAPGETVTITGTGWVPGELVSLELREDPFIDAHPLTAVPADADGNIVSREFAPDEDDLNITFYLTAKGAVSEAQAVFKDSNISNNVNVSPSTRTVTAGNSAAYDVTVSFGGNATPCTPTLSVTGLPTGASASFTSITGSSDDTPKVSSLTVTTTASGPNTTPGGTTVFTVNVAAPSAAGCNGDTRTATATLIVNGPTPTTLSLGTPSPASVTYGSTGPVTLTATLTRTNGGAAVGGATVDFAVDSVSVGTAVTNASTGVATLSTFNPSALNAIGHTVQASFAAATIGTFQYAASTSNSQTLTVNPADQTITFGTLADKTYGDTDFTVGATGGGSGNAVTFTASGDCTVSTATVHIVAAGSCTITAHQAGNANYNAALDVPRTFAIARRDVTAVIAVNDKPYDGNTSATLKTPGGRTLSGILPADETTLDFSISTLTFDTANAGQNKTVTATGIALTGGSAPNYQLTSTTATTLANISAADAHCTVTGYGVPYDATPHIATGACLGVLSETLTGLDLSATTHSDAGTYTSDPWTFTDVTGNYNNTGGTVNDAISKANASVVVNGYSGIYEGNAHGATLDHATGIGGVDLSAGIDLGASFTNVPGGTAHWTFSGGTNYFDQGGDATIAITPANANCSVTGYSVTYDATPHTATGSCAGVKSETLAGLDLAGTTHTHAGTFNNDPWTFTDVTGNYNNTGGTVNDAIAKANADCSSIIGYSATYDATAHTATGACKGVDGVPLLGLDLSATSHTDAGTYNNDPWTFTDATGNYNDTTGTVNDAIAKANASVVVTGYSGTFDGTPHGAALDHATGVGGVNLSAGITLGASFTNVPGGTAHWTFSGGTNYNDQSGDVSITINKASADCSSIAAYNVIYDGHAHTAAGNCTGVGSAVLGGLDLTTTTHTAANVWHDTWTFTDVTGNYNNTSGALTDVITYNVCVLYDQTKPNKKGSTIPLKISLCDASGNNVSAPEIPVQALTLTKVSGSVPPFDAEDSGDANPDSNFRYAGGFYIFNLSTKNALFTAGEWQLQLKVNSTANVYTLTFFLK